MRQINNKPASTQRELAKDLGFSLGKLNYCIKALKEKEWLKLKILKNQNKIEYIYALTPKGISYRTKLTINFMKRKIAEYDQLQKELKVLKKKRQLIKNLLL